MPRARSVSGCLVALLVIVLATSLGTRIHRPHGDIEAGVTAEGVTLDGHPLGARPLEDIEDLLNAAQRTTRIAAAGGGRIDDGIIPARWGLRLNVDELLRRLADAPPGARLEATYAIDTPERYSRQEPLPARAAAAGLNAVGLMVNVAWGGEHLEDLLEVLEKHQAQATFFVMGTWAAENPDAVSRMTAGGHEVGAHGYRDIHPADMTVSEFREDLTECVDLLVGLTGQRPTVYTPHYGEVTPFTVTEAGSLGLTTVLWTADTADWLLKSVDRMMDRVTAKTGDGSLILMHPTAKTPEFLQRYLEFLNAQGLSTLSCSRLLSRVPVPTLKLAEILQALDEDHREEEGR